jgi:exodeoxyribonuclease VII small subunit
MAKKTANENDAAEPGFEELLAEAERLAEGMEDGGLGLDESIRSYEKGVENLRRCADLLRVAEEKVQVLLEKNGAFRLEELDAPGAGDDDGGDGY